MAATRLIQAIGNHVGSDWPSDWPAWQIFAPQVLVLVNWLVGYLDTRLGKISEMPGLPDKDHGKADSDATGVTLTGDSTDTAGDPQAPGWGGLSWSPWHDFDQARDDRLIPTTPGLYRFRATGEQGLLYIGESGASAGGRWARLDDLARGRKRHPTDYYLNWRAAGLTRRPHRGHYAAPYFRQCEDAGCHIEVSWALEEHPDQRERRAAEERLIQLHYAAMGSDPPIQHGGRGVEGYLRRQHGA
jgi:hypothetical protein